MRTAKDPRAENGIDSPNLIRLDPSDADLVKGVADLHSLLLPESALSKWGYLFLTKFYYRSLVKDGLIDVYVYRVHDRCVGFTACTDFPFSLLKRATHKHWLRLALVMAASLVQRPSRVKLLLRPEESAYPGDFGSVSEQDPGQFMSFGVLEEYRRHVDEPTGLTVPNVLMQGVFKHFSARQKERFFLLVLRGNTRAGSFYRKYHGEFIAERGFSHVVSFSLPRTEAQG
ncbi:MAG: hypothetical protein H0T54_01245 [Geodermatophilaceae bacterium]|nr:hypothetical protein [Geodermatophilaceae bacterium]